MPLAGLSVGVSSLSARARRLSTLRQRLLTLIYRYANITPSLPVERRHGQGINLETLRDKILPEEVAEQ